MLRPSSAGSRPWGLRAGSPIVRTLQVCTPPSCAVRPAAAHGELTPRRLGCRIFCNVDSASAQHGGTNHCQGSVAGAAIVEIISVIVCSCSKRRFGCESINVFSICAASCLPRCLHRSKASNQVAAALRANELCGLTETIYCGSEGRAASAFNRSPAASITESGGT